MTRSPKGHGSLNLLPNGRWLAKIPVNRHPNGATRYRTKTFLRKSDARRWLSEMIALNEQKVLGAGTRQTLERYAYEVLLNGNQRISPRTSDGYLRSLRIHVFPSLGNKPLEEVRARELESLLGQLRRSHTASTVNNVRTALSKVYSIAIRHEIIHINPVSRTQKARKSEFEKTQVRLPWSQEEVRRALDAARDTPMEAILTVVLATGMRRGELLGLWWSDIDFHLQTVSIERTIHREPRTPGDPDSGGVIVCPPKTKSSRRINQLAPPVLDVLRRHQMEQDLARQGAGSAWKESDYVFTNNFGGPLDESKFYKQFQRFIALNGLRPVRFHDLRHTFATVLIEEDSGQLASVSKALGHSSIAITLDIYANTARIETHATSRMAEIMFPEAQGIKPIVIQEPSRPDTIAPGSRRAS